MKRLTVGMVLLALVLGSCSFGADSGRIYRAQFSRAVQVFPGVNVRVLGVDVGMVTDIKNVSNGVVVTFRIDDKSTRIPANADAAIVPESLLGERFIQLFPAYRGGPQLGAGATIPMSRTAVPAEPDELLKSINTYIGAIDSHALETFVANAAAVLQGNGDNLNKVIHNAAGILSTLSAKRDDLADLVVQLNKLTLTLASRQQEVGSLIDNYNTVSKTLTDNRTALEGTVTGLNDATFQLASLLIQHKVALNTDIGTLTQTGRTLDRNVDNIVLANKWAKDLFAVVQRSWSVVSSHRWIPLNNQGQPLAQLILFRLEQRLIDLCREAGAPVCTTQKYWAAHVPALFCFQAPCPKVKGSASKQLADAINNVPKIRNKVDNHNKSSGGSGSTQGTVDGLLHKLPGGLAP